MRSLEPRIAEEAARKRWLAERLHGIGGSDAPTVLDFYAPCDPSRNPWMPPDELWGRLVGLVKPRPDNEATEWGRRLQPELLQKLHEKIGDVVHSGTFEHRTAEALCVYEDPWHKIWQSREWPCMRCTPDGFTELGGVLVEAKTGGPAWEHVNDYTYTQVQHNLAVLGLERCVVSRLAMAVPHWEVWWVERDDEFIRALVQAETAFWRGVVRRVAPGTRAQQTSRTIARKDRS